MLSFSFRFCPSIGICCSTGVGHYQISGSVAVHVVHTFPGNGKETVTDPRKPTLEKGFMPYLPVVVGSHIPAPRKLTLPLISVRKATPQFSNSTGQPHSSKQLQALTWQTSNGELHAYIQDSCGQLCEPSLHGAAVRDSLLLGLELIFHWQTPTTGHLPAPNHQTNNESPVLTL